MSAKERIFISTATAIISQELQDALGLSKSKSDEVARQAVHEICRVFSKQTMYICEDRQFDLNQRDLSLWQKFNGRNVTELAVEFDLSEVQVYKIIKLMREQVKKRTEPQLPGFEL